MAEPPSNVTFGTVVLGTVLIGKDGPDSGRVPDASLLNGQATFTPQLDPSYPYLIDAAAGKLIFLDAVTCDVLNGEVVDGNTPPVAGIQLTSNKNLALNPQGWNWRLDLTVPGRTIGPMYFDVEPNVVNDLSVVAVVPSGSRGVGVVRGESAYEVWLSLGNTGTEEDFIEAITGSDGAGGVTDLTIPARTSTTVTLKANDGGQQAELTRATTSLAGIMAAADKTALNKAEPVAMFTAATQAAMLALSTKLGDFVKRTDEAKTYRRNGGTSGTMADYDEISGSGAVASVNGQTGAVTVTKASVGLGNVENYTPAAMPLSAAATTALNGKADTAALAPVAFSGTYASLTGTPPNLVLTNPFPVASQAAMLALSGASVGDIAIRSDNAKNYVLSALPASTLANWLELQGGAAPPVDPIPTTGGSRTLGVGANQAAAGNDGRFTDARDPKTGSVVTTSMADSAVTTPKINPGAVTFPKVTIPGTTGAGKVVGWNTGTSAWEWVTPAGGTANLAEGTKTATTVPITNSNGTSATLTAATTSVAGVMAAQDKIDLAAAFKGTVSANGESLIGKTNPQMRTQLNVVEGPFRGPLASFPAASANLLRRAQATDVTSKPEYVSDGTTWVQVTEGIGNQGNERIADVALGANVVLLDPGASPPVNALSTAWTDVPGVPSMTVSGVQPLPYVIGGKGGLGVGSGASVSSNTVLRLYFRIVDAAVTMVADSAAVVLRGNGAALSQEHNFSFLSDEYPASGAAKTWKLQVRYNATGGSPLTGWTNITLAGGAGFAAPVAGLDATTFKMYAQTVG